MATTGDGRTHGASRAFLVYNSMRLGLLAACLGIGWLATLRGIVWLVSGLAVSGILSWFLLRPQREAMGMAVERTVERSLVGVKSRTRAEDEYVDAHESARESSPVEEPSPPLGDPRAS